MELVTVSMGPSAESGVVLQSEWPVVSSLGEAMFLKLSGRSSCFPDSSIVWLVVQLFDLGF